jgi:cbb3-type cytochrome oxidase maturation protein
MESLYLLIPLSVVLILGIGALLVWAAMSGQFDSLDREGRRILEDEDAPSQGGAGDTDGRAGRRPGIARNVGTAQTRAARRRPRAPAFDMNQASIGGRAYDAQRHPPRYR